jgi:NADPH:quinone reductase-like Zn-dependent oxidoreductase
VKVCAASVNRTDQGMLRGKPALARLMFGFPHPKINVLGMEFAGIVQSTGAEVVAFQPGDRVFGMAPEAYSCHAEYVCVPADSTIMSLPENTDFCDAVLCEGVWYADGILRAFDLQFGHKILIYGAGGAIGIMALQLAKMYGAEVTAVVATRQVELAKSLGADRVIDYTKEDFTVIEDRFDFILDAVGKITYFDCRELLTPDGTFSATDLGPFGQILFLSLWSKITKTRRVVFPMPSIPKDFIVVLKQRMEQGAIKAIIDRHFPLGEIADAYRYVETEQKTGIVVLDVGE